MNKVTMAKIIDKFAAIKAKQAVLDMQAQLLSTQLKKEGGGESQQWRAALVRISAHTVIIKAHKQLRLYRKG